MSLKVNLIQPQERRSGSSLNPKSLKRIASIVIPASIATLIAQQILSSYMLSSRINILKSQWSAIEPKQKLAIKQTSRLNYNRQTLTEMEGWADARVEWNQRLAAIMQSVPKTIQLTSIRSTLFTAPIDKKDKKKAHDGEIIRNYQLSIEGMTRVPNSMQTVQTLQQNIGNHPLLAPFIETVSVENFAADATASNALTRIFMIQAKFKPLPLKEKP